MSLKRRKIKKGNLNNATSLKCIDFKTFHMHENIISLSTASVVIIRMVLGFWVVLKLKKKNPFFGPQPTIIGYPAEKREALVYV